MSPEPSDLPRWTNRKWLLTIFLVFLLQLALVLYLGERPLAPKPAPQFGTSIRLAVEPWSQEQLAAAPMVSDPMLFALPNPRSFSGQAWFTFSPLEYHFTDWSEPQRWLDLDTNRLAADFSFLVEKQETPSLLVADKPMPGLAGIEIFAPAPPMRTQSSFRFEGDLAKRSLVRALEAPSWQSTDILTNSVVQMIVDIRGFTVSAILLSTSGLKEADQFALKAATTAQFEPLPQSSRGKDRKETPSFGRLVFEWHTIAPKITNTAQLSP